MIYVIRARGDLGADFVLAPERWIARASSRSSQGIPLSDLVTLHADRARPSELVGACVLDTTHVKDGIVDVASASRAPAGPKSDKRWLAPGDLAVSRLRPYLRQIAFAHASLFRRLRLACSPEFFILRPREGATGSLAFLLPWLLSPFVQATLAAAQEGGHHPRVSRDALLALVVPHAIVRARSAMSRRVEAALHEVYKSHKALEATLALPKRGRAGRAPGTC